MEPLPPNVAMALAPGQALNSPSLTWAVRGDAQAWFSGLMRVPPAPCRAGGRMVHGHLSFMGRTSCRLTFGGLFTSPYQVGGGGGAGVGRAISPTPGRSPRRSLSRSGSRTCRSRADGPERDPQEVVSPPGTHGATSLKGVPSSWGRGRAGTLPPRRVGSTQGPEDCPREGRATVLRTSGAAKVQPVARDASRVRGSAGHWSRRHTAWLCLGCLSPDV